jgi:hypothetical protein
MDGSRFDSLTRALASPSRRAMFSALTTALMGGVLGLSTDDAEANTKRRRRQRTDDEGARLSASGKRKKGKGKKKRKKKRSTSPPTSPPTVTLPADPCAGITCAAVANGAATCQNGSCVTTCNSGFTLCSGACVDTQSHSSHCGRCSNPCPVQPATSCGNTGICAGGVCQKYPAGTVCRQASCSNGVQTLATSCDGNGNCPASLPQACPNGNCSGSSCGPCGNDGHCGSTRWCDAGICRDKGALGFPCPRDSACLSSICANGHCCGTACVSNNGTATCATGTCSITCAAGFANCDGSPGNGCETNTDSSAQHCGRCDTPCSGNCNSGGDPGTFRCEGGACRCSSEITP